MSFNGNSFSFCVCLVFVAFFAFVPAQELREGYFNGAADVRLNYSLLLYGHVGLSFKSCSGGELFSQHVNGNMVSLSVYPDGLSFVANVHGRHYEVKLPARLLNNEWHNVNILYRLGNLTLSAGGHQQMIANKSLNAEILSVDWNRKGATLVVGSKFHGCILQGPSLILEPTNVIQSNGVFWGQCPLKSPGCSKLDQCFSEPCLNHGTCVAYPDRFECHCTARYTGDNCERDTGSPCERKPCLNNGQCMDEKNGDFHCICDAAHSGRLCESNTNMQTCGDNICKNNGTCRVSPLTPDRPECSCMPGFRGDLCQININECQSNPCRNGGTCIDGNNSYKCECGLSGYTGENCDVNINECEPTNPCLNHGICFDNYGGYTCQCQSGFAGSNCELNLNECSSGPCLNGGTCVDQVGTYACHCRMGFVGVNCEIAGTMGPVAGMSAMPISCSTMPPPCGQDYDCVESGNSVNCICKPGFIGNPPNCTEMIMSTPCGNDICQNGGTCLIAGEMALCKCPTGFGGKTCAVSYNDCQNNPCTNGGTCVRGNSGYVCRCPDHRIGERCERSAELSPCASQPCANKGVCVAMSSVEFKCECPQGYSGETCLEEGLCIDNECPGKSTKALLDPCSSSPCNNGTCQPNADSFECHCTPGFIGDLCDHDIDECKDPNICNNGICLNTIGSYQCFCRPGYAGNQCDIDIDECLSHPCQNNASCENRINSFYCHCLPGFTGRDCATDIDECSSSPCQNGGSCVDQINDFICNCPIGLTGLLCQTNIDDCEPQPCLNGGSCIDGINSYYCDCNDTGYDGMHCQTNIDDCRSNPCSNGAKCIDLVKDYRCECYPGFTGENCQIDINECEKNPCMNGGTCYEHSNTDLYGLNNASLPTFFNKNFDIAQAGGYECVCVPGIIGTNCEKDLDECESNPCSIHGNCVDKIGGYECECHGGFEGIFCETEIDECLKYKPCDQGTCIDSRNDYYCDCHTGYGGKNCSVPLEGCNVNQCKNKGKCIPYLLNETEHRFNCSCASGFRGKICEKVTTMSLRGSSHVIIKKSREEGYDISFKVKTTLPNGLLAIGEGLTYYMLLLQNGRLNLRSSLLNRIEGVSAGSGLNDSKWQRVFVAINSSHLVLGANEEQTIYPITLTEANTSHTSFMTTYLGGTVSSLVRLANGPAFVGCMEDVVVNGEWIIPQDEHESPFNLTDIEEGCLREEQCNPNLCQSGGQCTDLWRTFSCTCVRPFLGHTCQYNYTAATFGHENTTGSFVKIQVNEAAIHSVRSVVDISMFIRTREERGFIYYLGSQPGASVKPNRETYIMADLVGGELHMTIQFGASRESYSVGGTRLDDGYNHLIQVVRNGTLVAVRINGTENFRKTISPQEPLIASVLYIGGLPPANPLFQHPSDSNNMEVSPAPRRNSRQIGQIEGPPFKNEATPRPVENFVRFKGVIQDVQVSNGTKVMVVEFFPLHVEDLVVPMSFGNVSFDPAQVLRGEVSDDTCRSQPCLHGGNCTVTWNDYVCECPHGHKGKSCEDMEFCQLQDCPSGSECRNLDDGYECLTNVTLRGNGKDILRYAVVGNADEVALDSIIINYRTHVGGTILHIALDDFYFSISAHINETTVSWRLDNSTGQQQRFSYGTFHEDWVSIYFTMRSDVLSGGFTDADDPEFSIAGFSEELWQNLVIKGTVTVGGLEESSPIEVTASPRLAYVIDPVNQANEIYVRDTDDTTGRYFKGCLGPIRIGGVLLPFFTPEQLSNQNPAKAHFELSETRKNASGCVLCFQDECMNGGRCENPSETHRCNCSAGYDLDDCSKDIDWCLDSPQCTNNATCVDGIANYTCDCQPGFTGPLCEIDIDECLSNPCIHGVCEDLIAGYKCHCEESYVGINCDNFKIITCDDEPCKNESTCSDDFNPKTRDNFTCSCADGFVDRLCNIPYCRAEPCKQNGRCDVKGKPRCLCPSGYDGKFCQNDIDECLSSPCLNNGICVDGVNQFSCDCDGTGFQGALCNEDIDECALHMDLCGDGVCNNTIGSYKCLCNPQDETPMCGYNCNITDPCALDSLCENGGTCMEACTFVPDYKCECPSGYIGKNCSQSALSRGPTAGDVAIIVGPIAAFLILAGGVGLTVFLMMARKKRATRGTYSPSQQEYCNPRVEMDNVLKPPPEERLI